MKVRSHQDIITASGGPHALAKALHDLIGDDLGKLQKRARQWSINDSIPGEYWRPIATLEVATVDELAAHADERRARRALADGEAAA